MDDFGCLAARSRSTFDEVYWTFIDSRYYGPFMPIEERAGLLGEIECQVLGELVGFKVEQAKTQQVARYYTLDKLVNLS